MKKDHNQDKFKVLMKIVTKQISDQWVFLWLTEKRKRQN